MMADNSKILLFPKLLIISGPTASGKTALAIKIARKFNGQLISADSRQIYKGMDIGTGKDHPRHIKIDLIDIITPDQTFSAAQYRQYALKKIDSAREQGKLPIIVGGSGQYIESILNPQPTFSVKPKPFLRFFLNRLPLSLLQSLYCLLDSPNYNALNNSEKHNPHRLIRKIEIKLSPNIQNPPNYPKFDFLHLNLQAENELLYRRIDSRVDARLKADLITEIRNLLKIYSWSAPGLNTLAYRQFKDYFSHRKTIEEVVDRWKYDEHAYARRQKTYFKRLPFVPIDITRDDYEKIAIDKVEQWYN